MINKTIIGAAVGGWSGVFWEVYQAVELVFIRGCLIGSIVWLIVAVVVWTVTKSAAASAAPAYAAFMVGMGATGIAFVIGEYGDIFQAAIIGAVFGAAIVQVSTGVGRRVARSRLIREGE